MAQTPGAEALAARLGVPLASMKEAPEATFIEHTPAGLQLVWQDGRDPVRFAVQLEQPQRRAGFGGRRGHPLARAVGRSQPLPEVWDLTAGFCRDAASLVALSYKVRAFERCSLVHALVRDALNRQPETSALRQHLVLELGDGSQALQSASPVDCIYLDPMFPPRSKSAKVKADMQALQRLVGHGDPDANNLLRAARQVAGRVVVKRPAHAPSLATGPDHVVRGTKVRWDVYLSRS